MFTTIEQVKELTGYDVEQEVITMAQNIIEAYVGKVEQQVQDPIDRMLLGKAVSYQSAYMRDNALMIFEQVATTYIAQFGQTMTFRGNDTATPFIAPLAVISCGKLSWKSNRSVKTGSMYDRGPTAYDWRRN